MPRMYDVLRNKGENPKSKSKDTSKTPALTVHFPRQICNISNDQNKPQERAEVSKKLINVVRKKGLDSTEIAEEKYNQALALVKVLLQKIAEAKGKTGAGLDLYINQMRRAVDVLINQLILGDSLLEKAAQRYREDYYLVEHLVNVCILSLAVGMQLEFNKSKLHTLGITALIYDMGMLSLKATVQQPRKLSADEFNAVKKHITEGARILLRFFAKTKAVYYDMIKGAIEQHHERINSRGYPLGLKEDLINDYAKILGLVDTYEAMTHGRSFRKANIPHQVVREILGPLQALFEPKIIKALLNKISIYPVGSFVILNNGDIAKVIATNSSSPLRPSVLVVMDAYGKRLPELKTLDLSKNVSIYIKEPTLLKE